MAFVVEDGTSKTNANAYITTAYFSSYHSERGNTVPDGISKEKAIVRASDYLDERFRFIGIRTSIAQSMEWPRINAFYADGRSVIGVPIEVQEACAEYALVAIEAVLSPSPAYDSSGFVLDSIDQSVGPIREAKAFAAGGQTVKFKSYPTADRKLKELVISGRRLVRI